MRSTLVLVGGALLGLVACRQQDSEFEKPPAPDMSELVRAYEAPSGVLDQQTANELVAAVEAELAAVEALGLAPELEAALGDVIDAYQSEREATETAAAPGPRYEPVGESTASRAERLEIEGDAFLLVTRICAGWGPEPVADRTANGYMTLNVGVTETGVDPVIWGDVVDCRYLPAGSRVLLGAGPLDRQGDLRVYVGHGVRFDGVGNARLLFDLNVDVSVDDEPIAVRSDFLVDAGEQRVELRVETSSGDIIAIADTELVGARAANGQFACDLGGRTCTSGTGDSITF